MIVDQASEQDRHIVSEVLHALRVVDSCYCRTELSGPWGLRMASCDAVTFHFLAEGRAWLTSDDDTVRLEMGDLAVFPHGAGHTLEGGPGTPPEWMLDLPIDRKEPATEIRHGGGGEPTLLICAGARFDPPDQPLVRLLPEVLYVRSGSQSGGELVEAALSAMRIEASERRPGGETVMTRLCDILVIQAVREWLATSPEARSGWIGALRDPAIGRALLAMHREPERAWTVAELASAAHMSRATFAERFSARVGAAPLAYLTERRMQLATALLRDDGLSPGEVATRVGYGSVAAFSRAYKRSVGMAPGAVRRAASAAREEAA